MKFIYYIAILFTVILRRVLFPIVFVAIPFRKYLRNTVYNYHLNNDIKLKRLYERNPVLTRCQLAINHKCWILDGGSHSSCRGLIERRYVSRMEYVFALSLWLFLDDDCNEDTYDKGFNETIINGERKAWMPEFIVKRMRQAVDKANMTNVKGNSFDLGDVRDEYPLFEFWSVFWWTLRNTAYNFNYKFNQIADEKKVFKIIIFSRLFGWDEDGYVIADGKKVKCYSWEFGKLYKKEI